MSDIGKSKAEKHVKEPLSRAELRRQFVSFDRPLSRDREVSFSLEQRKLKKDYRQVQDISQEIQELVERHRSQNMSPKEVATNNARISLLEFQKDKLLKPVILAENRDARLVDPLGGIYGVPIRTGTDQYRLVYGGPTAIWHLGDISPSIFRLGENLRLPIIEYAANTNIDIKAWVTLTGSTIQNRVQIYPGDIDFANVIEVKASHVGAATKFLAQALPEVISHSAKNAELEFSSLLFWGTTAQGEQFLSRWYTKDILNPHKHGDFVKQLSGIDSGRGIMNWFAFVDGHYTEMSSIIDMHVIGHTTRVDLLRGDSTKAKYQSVYLGEKPSHIQPWSLGQYLYVMQDQARMTSKQGDHIKTAKRLFNYFRAIGNLEGIERLKPIFITDAAHLNQQIAWLDAVRQVLSVAPPYSPWRILTGEKAREQIANAALLIEQMMPQQGAELRQVASAIQETQAGFSRSIKPDRSLGIQLGEIMQRTKKELNRQLAPDVAPIVKKYISQ